ncbi:hypothetical protein [Microcoleus sp. FACHB-831]|nr:hypothetical protein [Microcoleus sp. FACHB-831]
MDFRIFMRSLGILGSKSSLISVHCSSHFHRDRTLSTRQINDKQ